jgi:hypothetical protein
MKIFFLPKRIFSKKQPKLILIVLIIIFIGFDFVQRFIEYIIGEYKNDMITIERDNIDYFKTMELNRLLLKKFKNLSSHQNKKDLFEFRLIHNNIMNGTLLLKLSINGYTKCGYANKLYSMLTSLVIALLTDSAFIIRWEHIDLYIQEPFYKSFYDFGHEKSDFNAEYFKKNMFRPKALSAWTLYRNMSILIKTTVPLNMKRILYDDYDPYFFEICSNPIYYRKLLNYGLVSQETVLKAFEVTKNMSNFNDEEKQNYILKVPFEVGGNLLNKIWIPRNHILNKINYFVNNLFNGYYMIGIQLRYFYIQDPYDTYNFLNCVVEIENNLYKNETYLRSNYKGVKWYISSDTPDVLNRLVKEFPNKIIIGNGSLGHVEEDPYAYERAILDVELLSRCNELVVTGGSTFGLSFLFVKI